MPLWIFGLRYVCAQSLTMSPFWFLDRREAVLLPPLQQGVCRQVQSQGAPTDPFGCEKIPMQELLQNFLQDVSSAQAWGIWLLCSTLNWTGILFHQQKENPPSIALFFQAYGELSGNHILRERERGEGSIPNVQTFFFSTTGLFHFKVRNSSVLTCFSSQAVFLWLQSLLSFVKPCTHLPVLFMHFSACLECFICLHNVIFSVFTNVSEWSFCSPPTFFFPYKPQKRYQRAHYEWQNKYNQRNTEAIVT